MLPVESTLPILLVILSLGLIVPELFKRLHLPFVSTLILLGALLGPHGLDQVQTDPIIEFFGFLGFTFLMLMAGLETKISSLKGSYKTISLMVLANGFIPFLAGFGITLLFGYTALAALIVGTVFVSSSVAIIIPALKSAKYFNTKEGQLIVSAVIIEDILSLLMLAMIFQNVAPVTPFPLPLYFTILLISVVLLKISIPRLAKFFIQKRWLNKELAHEDELRFILVILIGVLVYFSALGVHPILAAFLVGLLLADVTGEKIYEKLHTLSYGLFVPVFFFIVGMEMDFSVFTGLSLENIFPFALIFGLIAAKFLSGFGIGRLLKLSPKSSSIFGVVTTTQLTTTLAAAFTAFSFELIDSAILTSIVMLSVITTMVVPLASNIISKSEWRKSSS